MISLKTILRTAVCWWSAEDECYVVESPLFDRVLGAEDTEEEAWRLYERMLSDAYEDLQNDKVAGYKRGRPAKGGVELHAQVQPDIKDMISEMSDELGISQGDAIALAVFAYSKGRKTKPADPKEVHTTVQDLKAALTKLTLVVDKMLADKGATERSGKKAERRSAGMRSGRR